MFHKMENLRGSRGGDRALLSAPARTVEGLWEMTPLICHWVLFLGGRDSPLFITQGSVPFLSYQMVQRLGRVLSRPRLLPQGQAQE